MEAVQQKGGEVMIFSSMHESGQRKWSSQSCIYLFLKAFAELNQLTGIAAILTFPLDVEIVEAEEKEAEEERKHLELESAQKDN